jgi:hypothetical protein
MIQVDGSIEINARCQDVWKFINDPKRFPEWVDSIIKVIDIPKEGLSNGNLFQEYGNPGPFKGYTLWRVVESKPPSVQIHKGVQGVMLFIVERHLKQKHRSTLFNQTIRMKFHTIMKPIEWILASKMRTNSQRQLDQTLINAKTVIEAESL